MIRLLAEILFAAFIFLFFFSIAAWVLDWTLAARRCMAAAIASIPFIVCAWFYLTAKDGGE